MEDVVQKVKSAQAMFYGNSYSKLPGRPKTSQRIAIASFLSNDDYGRSLKEATWKNKLAYCQRHGYDLYDVEKIPHIKAEIERMKGQMTHNWFFFKYLALYMILKGNQQEENQKQYDWVVWQDADSIYLNHGKRFEDIVDTRFDVILTVGPPDHQHWGNIVNAGSFIVRNSPFGLRFLEDVLKMSSQPCKLFVDLHPLASTPVNEWLSVCNQDSSYWLSDQGILIALYMYAPPEYRCHIKKTWFRAFNSEFPWYDSGDLAVHFPGKSIHERKMLINSFIKFSNFANGYVDRGRTLSLKHEPSLTSDLRVLEEIFRHKNPICAAPQYIPEIFAPKNSTAFANASGFSPNIEALNT